MQHEIDSPYPGPARTVLIALFLAAGLWYLHWRLGSFNPDALAFSVTLYAAEIFGFLTALLHLFMTWRLNDREPPPAQLGLTVDVFVPTINEPVDIVRRTVLAAMQMRYPHETWLLDDGNRPEMRALAGQLGCRYLAREGHADAKAGNLNHALARSTAQFIAVFDADHAPAGNFLERTLGFFRDPRVAFVQTPQDFYNLDSFQHRHRAGDKAIWTEQSLFFRVIQKGKDFWNAAFFCGSCGVMRRSALAAIGGFATGTVTEDLHTSIRLHKKGWRSIYHGESLAFGVAPATIVPYLRQRIRWGQGAMQVWRKEGILTARGLTVPQRLCYLASVLTYFDGWQKAVFYLAPIVVLLTGVMPVSALGWDFFARFVPYYVLNFLVLEEVARGYGRTVLLAQYNMARFFAFVVSTLGLFRRKLPFRVTSKRRAANERIAFHLAPQYAVLLLNALAVPAGLALYYWQGRLPLEGLVVNAAWAGANCLLATSLLSFTWRRSFNRRSEYRFPVPLPARIRIVGRPPVYATIDDISPYGCRIHARFPGTMEAGSRIDGEIYLPHRVLSFEGTVCARLMGSGEGGYVRAIGCRFDGKANAGFREALEGFLYGSDLQWQINRLREHSLTPLDRLQPRLANKPRRGPVHWAPVVLEADDGWASQVALVSCEDPADGGTCALLTFTPLPPDAVIGGLGFTRTGQFLLSGRIIAQQRFDSGREPVYLHQLISVTRGPQWIRRHLTGGASADATAQAA